ncbi:LacI family DNA-binding transcriptional regulator [Arthrobacter sp. A2-55]|uniref:LacI family DNA-binding transcriptional regulator n=1 Tax=Arthrobacter sp. A2-55 TaxID=2897337 RepID=UPI0021CD2664|nr:LacI family DNA-binding transcriptional regulator [Arthrobacter sp. A2-55]MCU6481452.1 LacI family DNA-binding transcriptional regulator [Arthrobacter sp. A2-55]
MGESVNPGLRPPVMEDVAARAGVSHQTVSRVINSLPNVSEKTRQRVEAAIVELGYRRNTAARQLVTRRSETLGVVAHSMEQYGPSHILLGIQEAAHAAGYAVNSVGQADTGGAAIIETIEYHLSHQVDGLVVIAPREAIVRAIERLNPGVPIVVIGDIGSSGVHSVGVDQQRGGWLATRHLIDLGHRTIAHIMGPTDWLDAKARRRGWEGALADAGLEPGPLLVGDWSAESGYEAGKKLFAGKGCTAVFAGNDQMSLGLMRAAHEMGLRIPEDLSVVGFDDNPDSGYFFPPLTTVRQDFAELGRRCVGMILDGIAGSDPLFSVRIQSQLVQRASTAPLPPAEGTAVSAAIEGAEGSSR